MSGLRKIVVLVAVNLLGFTSIALCYTLGLASGIVSVENVAFDTQDFFVRTSLTWIACALFSISYLFLNGKSALMFLWAPVAVPFAYGFIMIFFGGT